ncbi:hypothetical protein KVV02_002693 [Mortierella alpina]|uniref:Uncharacterized protein n=1 Tax=Mortierella alpina TaxID=64518 RepID=A0A9P8D2E1_MORAP|nr:hypothetical protein KVV02_002693 [Mortierella alpina]
MKASISASHRTSRFSRLPVQGLLTAGVIALVLSVALMPAESLPTALHQYPRADPLPSAATSSIPVPTGKPKEIPVQPVKGKGPPKEADEDDDNNNNDDDDDDDEADHYLKTHKLDFKILNPAPHDVWTSGIVESLTWVDTNLPDETTFDVALIPVDKETNPDALELTRRPVLRYIAAMERFCDILVPYDLISREQLLKEQEGEGVNTNQDLANITVAITNSTTIPTTNAGNSTTATTTVQDVRSLARLIITAYDGKTNKVLLQRSVFPIVIRKDHVLDWRKVSQFPPIVSSETSFVAPEGASADGEVLEKKDSEDTHLEDHDHEHEENEDDDDKVENKMVQTGEKPQDKSQDQNRKTEDSNGNAEEEDQIEHEDEINMATPTGKELEENEESADHSDMHMGDEHDHNEQGEAGEDEHGHGHGNDAIHRHMDDPNHFQSEEDLKLWNEHADDPGYNPPISVRDAGTIKITHWIDNKERFFVGAPYVLAWEFPESGKDLDGTVNVFVEDALTAKRYDIAAAEMLSDIQFMYLKPTTIMMSADPRRRIFLRARVELDLFKEGKIERYTGFSKAFWVERGAL